MSLVRMWEGEQPHIVQEHAKKKRHKRHQHHHQQQQQHHRRREDVILEEGPYNYEVGPIMTSRRPDKIPPPTKPKPVKSSDFFARGKTLHKNKYPLIGHLMLFIGFRTWHKSGRNNVQQKTICKFNIVMNIITVLPTYTASICPAILTVKVVGRLSGQI